MAEWSNAAVLKTVELARAPGVRIPLSPLNVKRLLKSLNFLKNIGEMPEWSNGAVSKTVVPFQVPRVRIPVSPQKISNKISSQVVINCELRSNG